MHIRSSIPATFSAVNTKAGPKQRQGRRHRVKRLAYIALALLLSAVIFMVETGWLSKPRPWQEVSGWTQLPEASRHAALPQNGPAQPQIWWLGHAGFLIDWHGRRLVLDPNLNMRCKIVPRLAIPPDIRQAAPVELAIVSHAHYDHFDLPTLAALPGLKTIAAPEGLDRFLPKDLAQSVHFQPMKAEQSFRLGPLRITALPVEHKGGRNHPFPSKTKALSYLVSDGRQSIYFAGDTAAGLDFKAIGQRFHPNYAILPIGAYAPRIPLKYHHMNPEEAVQAAFDLGADWIIPCHFGTFRLAFDAPDQALLRFALEADRRGLRWSVPFLQHVP